MYGECGQEGQARYSGILNGWSYSPAAFHRLRNRTTKLRGKVRMHSLFLHVGYLDPGTGSIIIQAVVGVTAGIAIFGRRMVSNVSQKARSLFNRRRDEAEDKEKLE